MCSPPSFLSNPPPKPPPIWLFLGSKMAPGPRRRPWLMQPPKPLPPRRRPGPPQTFPPPPLIPAFPFTPPPFPFLYPNPLPLNPPFNPPPSFRPQDPGAAQSRTLRALLVLELVPKPPLFFFLLQKKQDFPIVFLIIPPFRCFSRTPHGFRGGVVVFRVGGLLLSLCVAVEGGKQRWRATDNLDFIMTGKCYHWA